MPENCQLASQFNEKYIKYPCIVEPKLDGMRCLTFIIDGTITHYSRAMKQMHYYKDIFKNDIFELIKNKSNKSLVLDGEVIGIDFLNTMRAKGEANSKQGLIYNIFDIIALDEWNSKMSLSFQDTRFQKLNSLFFDKYLKTVKLVRPVRCNNILEIHEVYNKFLFDGYEGIIIKNITGLYEWKRSKNWIKLKPTETFDCKIIDIVEGEGKNKNTMGAIKVTGFEKGINFITFVGSGFTDAERHNFWQNQHEFIGKTVEIKAQGLSQSQAKDIASLRFPIFIRLREDK